MTRRAKRYSCFACAVALMVFPACLSAASAGGNNDANLGAGPVVATTNLRTAPVKLGRRRPAEERASVNSHAGKRDPFEVPPPPKADGGGDALEGPLPPGARGLVIGQISLKGIVRDEESKTMIAVVTNHANLAYFLHIHEDVYNGVVTRITPDAIYFQKKRPDSGGQMEAREVVLRLGSEQQEAR